MCRGLDAKRAITKIDLVEIHLEDLGLLEFFLERQRDAYFPHLARNAADPLLLLPIDFVRKERTGKLHCDRGESLLQPTELEYHVLERTEKANPVDTMMFVEALVLDGEKGGRYRRRHRLERHDRPLGLAEITDLAAVGCVDLGRLVLVGAVDARDRWAAVVGAGAGPEADQEKGEKSRSAEQAEAEFAPIAGVFPEATKAGEARGSGSSHGHEAIRGLLGLHG